MAKAKKTYKITKPKISRRRIIPLGGKKPKSYQAGKKTWKYSYRFTKREKGKYVPVKRRFEPYQSEILKTTQEEKDELASFFDAIMTSALNAVKN